jgi:hypothetical protein
MGWCSGTRTFDVAMELILNDALSKEEKVKALILAWINNDWDCKADSKYWDHDLFQEALLDISPWSTNYDAPEW